MELLQCFLNLDKHCSNFKKYLEKFCVQTCCWSVNSELFSKKNRYRAFIGDALSDYGPKCDTEIQKYGTIFDLFVLALQTSVQINPVPTHNLHQLTAVSLTVHYLVFILDKLNPYLVSINVNFFFTHVILIRTTVSIVSL